MDRTSIGHYRVVRPLGSGGMGDVYVARDTKLDRDVALKILPAAMATDAERRERFGREARAVAALNHPNIVTVHSVEEADGVLFLTMELVEGRTLADLIPTGGLSIDQLLRLAVPLADAVSAAHARGITHRDLKPANVMVSNDGRVKVLDFGLAKLNEDAKPAESLTTMGAQRLTSEGHIVGTVAYMSPEQAEGKPIDHRTDIFSLGVMLYEMAVGERPFKGDTNVSTLTSILRDSPRPITEVRPALPRDLGKIVRRALSKDPEHRFQSAKDLRNELEELQQDLASGETAVAPSSTATARSQPARWWIWAAAALVLIAAGWFLVNALSGSRQLATSALQANYSPVTSAAGIETKPSLSPDGKWIVYAAAGDIFSQGIGGQVPRNLTEDSPVDDSQPAFSPDGESIAFRSARNGGGLYVMSKTGEGARKLTDAGFDPAWTPDGKYIVYASVVAVNPEDRSSLSEGWKVEVATGKKTRLLLGDVMQPAVSPHGRLIAYWGMPLTATKKEFAGNSRDLWVMEMDGSNPRKITDDPATDWSPVWSSDGRWLYFASDRAGTMNLWRIAIDESSGKTQGQPEQVTTPAPWLGFITLSQDGHKLAYAAYQYTRNVARVPFDPVKGVVVGPVEDITTGTLDWYQPDPSPDGNTVVVSSYRRQEDLYVLRRDAGGAWSRRQLTNDAPKDRMPRWSPDGSQIAFYTNDNGPFGIWTINPDGSARRQRVAVNDSLVYGMWSGDASRVLATQLSSRHNYLFALADSVSSEPIETLPPPPPSASAAFAPFSWSPDDNKLVGHIGAQGLFVYSFKTKSYEQVTTSAGGRPAWLADSRRVLYHANGRLYLVDTATKQSREIMSMPGEVLEGPRLTRDNKYLYFTHAVTAADIWLMTLK